MRDDSARTHSFPKRLVLAAAVAAPGCYLGAAAYLGLPSAHLAPPLLALTYGVAIIGAAFILSWAAEAAQVDINAGLALALLALLAVLPEYAVDFVFAVECGSGYQPGQAGGNPEACSLALANMTGANRVLVGVGWPLVVLVATLAVWLARRSTPEGEKVATPSTDLGRVRLAPAMSVELTFLGLATLYSLTLPLRTSLSLVDSVVFVALFAGYAWRLAKMPASEPDLIGVSEWVGTRDKRVRRTWVTTMFVGAAVIILLSAEHFAQSLVKTGDELGISKFLLVQWIAPLASESPELIVACLYAWRLKAADSLGTLLSSKVNQWTLLVGGLPIVFALTALTNAGLPLDTEQRYELLITGAQSLFAVAILIDRSITFRGAVSLLSLFLVQFFVSVLGTPEMNRITIIVLSCVYVVLALGRFALHRRTTRDLVVDGTVTSPEDLAQEPEPSGSRA
jgi:cation:H+ antiporter